jgi:putative DNA primase/helicase
MTAGIDFATINSAALRNGRSLVQDLIPGGKFRSLEYVVKNPCRKDERPGSFTINYRDGVWKDFATDDGGSDFISLVAYVKGLTQGEAAHDLATKLGVSPAKSNGFASKHKANGNNGVTHKSSSLPHAPKIFQWGDDGPPIKPDEMRRHVYRSGGCPLRIKIKLSDGKYLQWYRAVGADGVPIGWQSRKPVDYHSIPYVTQVLDPFDSELVADEIYWLEGERDVESLNKLNLPAFTFGGVGDGLPDDITEYLKGRKIVVLADNDDPGRAHAEKKAAAAHAAGAAAIKVLHFPELPPKSDVSDFIGGGGTAEQLLERVDTTPLWQLAPQTETSVAPEIFGASLMIRLAADIKAQPVTWLWPSRIAIGKQTLIAGDPGLGKSQLTAYLAAIVSKGRKWPCGEGQAIGGSVVIFSAEDDAADTIVPRLIAADADLDRVSIVEAVTTDDGRGNKSRRMFNLQADLTRLETELTRIEDVRLVIIDPITAYLGGVDTHRNSDVRGVLGMVAEMAARHHVAVVAVSHWNKSGVGTAVNRVTGSGAFTAAVRAAFMVAKDPDDEERRLFIPMKNNLARTNNGLAFRLEQQLIGDGADILVSSIVWDGQPVTQTADEILAATDSGGVHGGAREEAAEWLEDLLAKGAMAVKDIQDQTEAAGLRWATVRRAKDRLGIKPERVSEGGKGAGRWMWALPGSRVQDAQKSQDAHVPDVSTLQKSEHLAVREAAGD